MTRTNRGHSGDWIDEVLTGRLPVQHEPVVMSDALLSSTPQGTAVEKVGGMQAFHKHTTFRLLTTITYLSFKMGILIGYFDPTHRIDNPSII